MKSLLESINNQTETFKVQFLKEYKESLINEYNSVIKEFKGKENLEIMKSIVRYDNDIQFDENYGCHYLIHATDTHQFNNIYALLEIERFNEFDKYISKEMTKQAKHFESKQVKLAKRLMKQGMNENVEVSIFSEYPNLDGNATDGKQTVNFFTIVASGAVQKPHFRYLVK